MSNSKKTQPKPEKNSPPRAGQLAEERRRDMATRSTLARLRNRKSALK
jgi:hypothetical protein